MNFRTPRPPTDTLIIQFVVGSRFWYALGTVLIAALAWDLWGWIFLLQKKHSHPGILVLLCLTYFAACITVGVFVTRLIIHRRAHVNRL